MAAGQTTSIRLDPELKAQAQEVFDNLGLSLTSAITIFLKASVREQGLPFDMRLANENYQPPRQRQETENEEIIRKLRAILEQAQ